MKKIVFVPLDERPCNYEFPYKLFNTEDMSIVRPEKLGNKKQSANSEEVIDFLTKECKEAYALVLSIDTLLYGGLIPSRLHHSKKEEIENRLETIKRLKEENPKMKIYAFQCIMRCPKYSSADEEPDYYEECGFEIHQIGNYIHKRNLGITENTDITVNTDINENTDITENTVIKNPDITKLEAKVKPEYLKDYRDRRDFNLSFNLKTLEYLNEGFIDYLIIPQDDSAKYGFTAMDQEIVREKITSLLLQDQVVMYPGADEIALTLLARVVNEIHGKKPKVFVKYASVHAPFIIPAYEDRTLGETIKYHIMASGCKQVSSYAEADFVIALSAPGSDMQEAKEQPVNSQSYCVERNIIEFVDFIKDCILDGKPVTVGDNAYSNGSELELVKLLNKHQLLHKVAGYAGWNTSSNTIGTAMASGVNYLYHGETKEHLDFLASRYVEDAGYCSVVRTYVTNNKLQALEMNYFDVHESNGIVSKMVEQYLNDFVNSTLSSISNNVLINSVYMPWRRMFEVGLDITYIK